MMKFRSFLTVCILARFEYLTFQNYFRMTRNSLFQFRKVRTLEEKKSISRISKKHENIYFFFQNYLASFEEFLQLFEGFI